MPVTGFAPPGPWDQGGTLASRPRRGGGLASSCRTEMAFVPGRRNDPPPRAGRAPRDGKTMERVSRAGFSDKPGRAALRMARRAEPWRQTTIGWEATERWSKAIGTPRASWRPPGAWRDRWRRQVGAAVSELAIQGCAVADVTSVTASSSRPSSYVGRVGHRGCDAGRHGRQRGPLGDHKATKGLGLKPRFIMKRPDGRPASVGVANDQRTC